eukprot:1486420-Alexandrium_andersonii.AAC.2
MCELLTGTRLTRSHESRRMRYMMFHMLPGMRGAQLHSPGPPLSPFPILLPSSVRPCPFSPPPLGLLLLVL